MGLADFFLYGGSSGGGGGSVPETWDTSKSKLSIDAETTTYNELGWGCLTPVDYYDEAVTWTSTKNNNTATYTKGDNGPVLMCSYLCTITAEAIIKDYNYSIVFSTDQNARNFTVSGDVTSTTIETGRVIYDGHTWYYAITTTNNCYENGTVTKLSNITIPNKYEGSTRGRMTTILIQLLGRNGVVFENENKKTEVSNPSTGIIISGGGTEDDGSDATFVVQADGTVYGREFVANGSPVVASDFVGATSSENGIHGYVPAPSSSDVNKFLKGNGTWAEAGTPGNWNINPTSLVMQDTGKEVNSLGWYCGNKENYYEEAKTWSVYQVGGQYHEFSKSNNKPALLAAVKQIDSIWVHSICVSTVADATHFTQNSQDNEFEYLGETWYWSGGEYSLSEGDYTIAVSGINRLPDDTFATMLDAAKFLIDQGLVSFNSGKKTILSDPSQEHIILGGGIQDDGSDATFKVSNAGVIEANGMVVNGVAVTSAFTGATSSAAGSVGLVPAPGISDREKILKGDGTWMTQKPSPISYSTNEQDTRIKWIDGNKIYQKTYDLGGEVAISSSGTSIDSYISNIDDIGIFITATALTTGSIKQCSSIWFGYDSGTLKAYCNEGMMASHITLTYTKIPSLDDAVITTSNFNFSNASASQQAYVYKNWRSASSVFHPGYRNINITADLDGSAVYMWSTYETAERIDGCDWLRYDHSESFVPYCVGIWAHSSNAWGGTYPTIYLEFSNDGTTWDTLYTGIPTIPAGTCCYIPVDTSNSYTKFRIRYNNGTGALGSEWNGALPNITIYGE